MVSCVESVASCASVNPQTPGVNKWKDPELCSSAEEIGRFTGEIGDGTGAWVFTESKGFVDPMVSNNISSDGMEKGNDLLAHPKDALSLLGFLEVNHGRTTKITHQDRYLL